LSFSQACQKNNLAIWKFQRIVVGSDPFFIDLSKDCRLVFDHLIRTTQYTNQLTFNLANKGQLGSWSDADRNILIF
jgi:hypothetical protein